MLQIFADSSTSSSILLQFANHDFSCVFIPLHFLHHMFFSLHTYIACHYIHMGIYIYVRLSENRIPDSRPLALVDHDFLWTGYKIVYPLFLDPKSRSPWLNHPWVLMVLNGKMTLKSPKKWLGQSLGGFLTSSDPLSAYLAYLRWERHRCWNRWAWRACWRPPAFVARTFLRVDNVVILGRSWV